MATTLQINLAPTDLPHLTDTPTSPNSTVGDQVGEITTHVRSASEPWSVWSGLEGTFTRFSTICCLFVSPTLRVWRDPSQGGWIPTRSATPSTALVPQRKVGFPIPNPRLLLGFQGTKSARREGISSPFSDAGGCTSPQNSGGVYISNANEGNRSEDRRYYDR